MKKNFKNAPGNGRKNNSNLKREQHELLKSFCSDLTLLEINLFLNISMVYSVEECFMLSNLQLAGITGASEVTIEKAINHLIELRYFKIVPSPKNFSFLRYLEPDEEYFKLMGKLFS